MWQLWRACVPRKEIASDAQLSDAQRCLLQELARDSIEGCTTYRVEDTDAFVCDEFTMAPGDVLYMPKGVVHYATTADSISFHLTIGLHRDNRQWVRSSTRAACWRARMRRWWGAVVGALRAPPRAARG